MSEHEPIPVVLAPPSGTAWMEVAACRGEDPALFYSDDEREQSRARRVCSQCPVQMECLDYALANGERDGMWGGTGERERRGIARSVHGTPERYQARRCRCPHCASAVARWRTLQKIGDRIIEAARRLSA